MPRRASRVAPRDKHRGVMRLHRSRKSFTKFFCNAPVPEASPDMTTLLGLWAPQLSPAGT
jgi:hypothetical protein